VSLLTYLLIGVAVMIVKFAIAMIAAKRHPEAKARLKKLWTVWALVGGVLVWPFEAAHTIYVLVNYFLCAAIEAA
jgi:hypothetical protein